MKRRGGVVDLAVLLVDLQQLREVPLGGDAPAVACEERLAALLRELGQAVGVGLRGVVLPQLRPGVRTPAPLLLDAQRRAVGARRQHRAGGEVDADADHPRRLDARARRAPRGSRARPRRRSRADAAAPSRGRAARRCRAACPRSRRARRGRPRRRARRRSRDRAPARVPRACRSRSRSRAASPSLIAAPGGGRRRSSRARG